MASSKEFLDFVLEQLSILPDVGYRRMMGEYVIYYRGKVIGGIYDNRLLIKPTSTALNIMPNARMGIPYTNAKPMIMIDDIENSELLTLLFNTVYAELPNKPKSGHK